MSSKLTTLESWAAERFGEHAPSIFTLRAWARDGKIYPLPQKIGRTYFVSHEAEYVRDYNDNRLASRIRVT